MIGRWRDSTELAEVRWPQMKYREKMNSSSGFIFICVHLRASADDLSWHFSVLSVHSVVSVLILRPIKERHARRSMDRP